MPGSRPTGEIYLPLAVAFASDPKVRALAQFGADAGLARDLFVQMCCHCKANLTDGFVAEYELGILVYPLDVEHGKQLAKHLAYVELIKPQADGWQVLGYLKRNGSREDVDRLSKVRAEAGRAGGRKSRKPAGQTGRKANGKQVAYQGASNYPPRDRDREVTTEPPNGGSGAVAPSGEPNPAPVVAAFIEGATGAGLKRPDASIIARVGKQARLILAQGTYTLDEALASARNMGAGEWNDLAVQLRKDNAAANGSGGSETTGHRKARQAIKAGHAVQAMIDEGRLTQ